MKREDKNLVSIYLNYMSCDWKPFVSENMSFSFCFVWAYTLANAIKGEPGYMIAHIQLFLFSWYNSASDSSTSLQIQS